MTKENSVESLEITARTVREAIEIAIAKTGQPEESLDISILSEGSRGILGIGSEQARILVSVMGPPASELEPAIEQNGTRLGRGETAAVAVEVLQTLLDGMHLPVGITVRRPAPDADLAEEPITLDVTGENMGILIGRRGETLSSLQFLTNMIVSRRTQHWPRIVIDIEGYRIRREEYLKNLARRLAERVQASGQPVSFDPMPAHERRIIHIYLRGSHSVTTESTGQGDDRRVVVYPV
jgi:spoIIIJ-associated protein